MASSNVGPARTRTEWAANLRDYRTSRFTGYATGIFEQKNQSR